MELKLRPAFLGGVMQASGNKPPAMVPNKALYMTKDLEHLASFVNIPLRSPADPFDVMFSKGSLAAMRFITAVAEKDKGSDHMVEKVSRELWNRIWSRDQDICEPESFSEVLCRYRNVWNIELKLRPAFLGGVMRGSDNRSPAMVPSKCPYIIKDLTRLASYMNVPLRQPSDFADVMFRKGTLAAMRFITATAEKHKGSDHLVEKVSRELWMRMWTTDQDICEPASLSEAGLMAGMSSREVEALLDMATSQPIKDKLKQVTQEALDNKAFGFPFIICHINGKPEVFFGSDRFELIAYYI
ncbi:glutathione S-transferase kappa 1-like, partial [Clarias magur]